MRSITHSIVPGTKICLIFPQFQNYTILGQSELNHIIILFKKIMRSYIRLFKISDVKYIMPRFSYYVFEKNWVSEIFWDLVSSQWPLKRLSFPERNLRLIFSTKMTLSLPKFPPILVTALIRVGFGMGSFRDLESQIPIPIIRDQDEIF